MYDVIVVGGGLAGLICSTLLSRANFNVVLFEKKSYPFHRVCGEYVSNEVRPFLEREGLFPQEIKTAEISKFELTSINGKKAELNLEMGGFGISRYAFDHFLFEQAQASGVEVVQNASIDQITFDEGVFRVDVNGKVYESKVAVGAFGKRSKLDRNRNFMKKRSPYLAVKYHIETDCPEDKIALHNFKDGYCGISRVEGNRSNLCYLSHRNNLRYHKNIEQMEHAVLHENPFLKKIWNNAYFLFKETLVINEISFEKKELIYDHILMCGDTAGMITPLCGNGMAMAIRSAKLLADIIIQYWNNGNLDRPALEEAYMAQWNRAFAARLYAGRLIQNLFGAKWTSNAAVNLTRIKPVGKRIVRLTHGRVF